MGKLAMFLSFIAITAAVQAMPTDGGIVLRHTLDTIYNRSTYEAACGSTILAIGFSNRREGKAWGRVEQFGIGGISLPEIAEQLTRRASGRVIARVEVMNCGMDQQQPEFNGTMEMAIPQSQRMRLPPNSYFTVRKVARNWVLTFK